MKFLFDDSPIIACSTSMASNGAIGVIRLSGFSSLSTFQKMFSCDLSSVIERRAIFTSLVFEDKVIDEVVMTFFKAPYSYNGENILEIAAHGNVLNLQKILDLFIREFGLRLAYGGEFTYRALKNKKLSLSQVEGLDLLLNASNPYVLEQGKDILFGELNQCFLKLHSLFKDLKSSVELFIDFLDDVGEEGANNFFQKTLKEFDLQLDSLYRRSQIPIGGIYAPEVVIAGETNAGKSSLFNFLLGRPRAIISEIPGTTRDFISEVIQIEDTPFKVIDTAGMREETEDQIEKEGMFLGKDLLKQSFFRILVINPHLFSKMTLQLQKEYSFDLIIVTHTEDSSVVPIYEAKLRKDLFLENFKEFKTEPVVFLSLKNFNYCLRNTGFFENADDLSASGPIGPASLNKNLKEKEITESGPIGPLVSLGKEGVLSGPIGPANMKALLLQIIYQKYSRVIQGRPILLSRQRELIAKIYFLHQSFYALYGQAGDDSSFTGDVAILDHQLREIEYALVELIGMIPTEDVLNNVFDHFCIGK